VRVFKYEELIEAWLYMMTTYDLPPLKVVNSSREVVEVDDKDFMEETQYFLIESINADRNYFSYDNVPISDHPGADRACKKDD